MVLFFQALIGVSISIFSVRYIFAPLVFGFIYDPPYPEFSLVEFLKIWLLSLFWSFLFGTGLWINRKSL